MADVESAPSFGAELRDGFKPANAWVAGGIAWLEDIQQFYRERSAIEKEYAGKLSALAKKYFEKKARKQSSLSVGDTPTVTPGSLESASMTTWTVQLTTLESRAAEHDKFAGQLVTNLAEPLRVLAGRYEELRKAHVDYAGKLEKERDSSYAELRKVKGKYDSVCQEVENRRKKTDSAFDHGKGKAQVAYQNQLGEMHNIKNTYLININVTNKQKERYYHEYVPELLDSLQDLSETRVHKLNSIWSLAATIETATLTKSTEYLNHLAAEIPRNNPMLDSMMFARHNATNWHDPPDFVFEPSPVWHDDDAIVIDSAAKTFLQNMLSKSKSQLTTLGREMDAKRKDVNSARQARQRIRDGKDKRDEVECVRAIFGLQEALHEIERQKITAEVEVSTIKAAVGDISLSARNHNFKSETFKIPTNCDLCGDRIWGLSAKGFSCKDCGYTCHSKCEMKVPADCPGEQSKEEKKKLKSERQEAAHTVPAANGSASESPSDLPRVARSDTVNSMNTLSSGYSATAHRSISGAAHANDNEAPAVPAASKPPASRRNRIVAPPPTQYVKDDGPAPGGSESRGRMMYAYQANGEGEISVTEGKSLVILDSDDGAGWMKVRCGADEGLVPASYVEALTGSPDPSDARPSSLHSASSISLSGSTPGLGAGAAGKKKGPAVAPKRGAKKLKYVTALYDYEARSDAEHSIVEGERCVLIQPDTGDGWVEVEKGGQVRSVPANYVQAV